MRIFPLLRGKNSARPRAGLRKRTPMKYETILFDLDGTLLYTVRDLANAVNHALEKHGFPTHSEERIARMVGNGVRKLVARALPRRLDTPGFEEILADFRAY